MKVATLITRFNHLPIWRLRLRVWNFTITAPTFDRWLYLWMHRLGCMGRKEAAVLQQLIRPGMHVADVGANLGLYSLLLARCAGPTGRVYCFEPDAVMAGALRRNINTNNAAQAEVFECAIGAATGSATLKRNVINSGDSRLDLTSTRPPLHSEQTFVPVRALGDMLKGRRLDFIKMDIQGWEGEALRGIASLLDINPKLKIYFEFWPHGLRLAGTEITQLADTLRELGLQVTLAEGDNQTAKVDLLALDHSLAPKAFINLLAQR